MDFESILEEILLGTGQGNLKLKPKQEEVLQAIVFGTIYANVANF